MHIIISSNDYLSQIFQILSSAHSKYDEKHKIAKTNTPYKKKIKKNCDLNLNLMPFHFENSILTVILCSIAHCLKKNKLFLIWHRDRETIYVHYSIKVHIYKTVHRTYHMLKYSRHIPQMIGNYLLHIRYSSNTGIT